MMYTRRTFASIMMGALVKAMPVILGVCLIVSSFAYSKRESDLAERQVRKIISEMEANSLSYSELPDEFRVERDNFCPGEEVYLSGKYKAYSFRYNGYLGDELKWEFSGWPAGQLMNRPEHWMFVGGMAMILIVLLYHGIRAFWMLTEEE